MLKRKKIRGHVPILLIGQLDPNMNGVFYMKKPKAPNGIYKVTEVGDSKKPFKLTRE